MSLCDGLKAAIGANVTGYSGKVFPLVAPEGSVLPYATYQQINDDPLQTLSGYSGYTAIDYQITFYANTYLAAESAAKAWKAYIKNFSGAFGTNSIQAVKIIGGSDDSDYVASKIRYKNMVDCRFYYVE
jgi:hypothetical protein